MRLVLDHEWAAKVAGNSSNLALANQNQPDIPTDFPGKESGLRC
jgi:hypothetical protein